MKYTFNKEYTSIAAKFPISDLAALIGYPVLIIPKALSQLCTRETYANIRKAKANGTIHRRATVYAADGVGTMTAENYRSTDIFPAVLAHNSVSTSTQLNDLVRDAAKRLWGIDSIDPIGAWWIAGYNVGDKFDSHCDGAIRLTDGTYRRLNERLLSAILYINEKDSDLMGWGYTGGALVFAGILDEAGQPLTIHPKEGDLIIFPSSWTYSHAVTAITSGYRVALTNFFG